MKPSFVFSRLFAAAAIAGLLGACGQKGPLYLPAKPADPPPVSAPAQKPAPAASTTPAPASK